MSTDLETRREPNGDLAAADDRQLLEAWRDGERAAGEVLFARYFDAMYRFFVNKAPDAVEDLIQRVLAACVASKERYRGDASFRTYIYTIARNELYRYWRRRARNGAVDFSTTAVCDLAPSASSLLSHKVQLQLLKAALTHIPIDMQVALELHYWEDMSGPQLAQVLQIPEGTVRSRLRRAKQSLRKAMDDLARTDASFRSGDIDFGGWAAAINQEHVTPL